jgi:hypothetical protein
MFFFRILGKCFTQIIGVIAQPWYMAHKDLIDPHQILLKKLLKNNSLFLKTYKILLMETSIRSSFESFLSILLTGLKCMYCNFFHGNSHYKF